MKVSVSFNWYDLWMGVYYDRDERVVYVCPLPTLVIKLKLKPQYDNNLNVWPHRFFNKLQLSSDAEDGVQGKPVTRC